MREIRKVIKFWRELADRVDQDARALEQRTPTETATQIRKFAAEVEGAVAFSERRWRRRFDEMKHRIDALMVRCWVAEDGRAA